MKKGVFVIGMILTATLSMAQNTWSKNVAQIVYDNCSNCHNPNGIAPFSLLSYADVKPNIFSIKGSIESGSMPPWIADTKYERYAHERVLTTEDTLKIDAFIKQSQGVNFDDMVLASSNN